MAAEQRLQDLILQGLDALGGRAKISRLARKTLETGAIQEASLRSIKAEIWRMVDQGGLTWTSDREVVATMKEASR